MTMLPFGQVAPIARRVWAYVIDALIAAAIPVLGMVVAVSLVFGPLNGTDPATFFLVLGLVLLIVSVLTIAWAIVFTLMQARGGSIGMRAQGLRMVKASDGGRVGFWRALLRNIVFSATAAFVVGMFSPLFDGSGRFQGWHDMAGGALMMDARVTLPTPQPVPAPPVSAPPPAPSGGQLKPAPMPGFVPATRRDRQQDLSAPDAGGLAFAPAPPAPAPAPPAPAQPAAPVDGAAPLIASVPGVTRSDDAAPPPAPASSAAPPFPAPVPTPPAPPAAEASDIDDDDDLEQTRLSVPGHRLVLTWDDGTRATVSRRTVFGRHPAEEPGASVVSVRDETLSLSKTHFEVAAEASGGWLRDRHSTNGTVLIRDGVRIECTPGERVPIKLGDVIEIGDRTVAIGGYV